MKKVTVLLLVVMMITSFTINAQVAVNTDGSSPDSSSILDVQSTDKGILFPRMTEAEIATISNPANGLTVFNTDDNRFYFYVDGAGEWKEIAIGAGTITPPWICGDALVDDRDGKSYNTVLIGSQCWMAENLNIGARVDGNLNQTQNTPSEIIEKYCFNDEPDSCDVYGGLYQWDEMMQYVTTEGEQGICSDGWHIPTDDEWKIMEMHLGMSQSVVDLEGNRGTDEGGKMKETGTTHWNSPNTGATNSSGLTALPGGYCQTTYGNYHAQGIFGRWWTSSEYSSLVGWCRGPNYNNAQVMRGSYLMIDGLSVRCVRD